MKNAVVDLRPGQRVHGYCTKYALTKGIYVLVAEVANNARYAHELIVDGRHGIFMIIGTNFFLDKELAERRVAADARNKMKSLKKQLDAMQDIAQSPKYANR